MIRSIMAGVVGGRGQRSEVGGLVVGGWWGVAFGDGGFFSGGTAAGAEVGGGCGGIEARFGVDQKCAGGGDSIAGPHAVDH